MKNTTEIMSRKRIKLKEIAATFIIISICFSVVIILLSMVITKNLNGEVNYIEITIKEISTQNDTTYVISEKGQEYSVGSLADDIKWSDYLGKTVTIVSPNEQFAGDPWIIGLVDKDNNVIIDYTKTISDRKTENITVISVISAIVGSLLIATIVLFFIYRKTPAQSTVSVDELIWMFNGWNLPKTPKRNKAVIPIALMFILILIVCSLMGFFGDKIESDIVGGTLAITTCVVVIACIVSVFVICFYYLPKEEIKYYKANYPFNSDDVSHLAMRRSLKKAISEDLKEQRRINPDKFSDSANGLDAEFTSEGLHLSAEIDEDDMEFYNDGVFDEFDGENGQVKDFEYTIPYDELHFEALPKYKKYANMFGLIIKSNLSDEISYPKEIQFDIHIIFDSNILATLRKFNVEVKELDYILENIDTLMKENCKKAKSGLNTNNY